VSGGDDALMAHVRPRRWLLRPDDARAAYRLGAGVSTGRTGTIGPGGRFRFATAAAIG
jgi:hypothetical protein